MEMEPFKDPTSQYHPRGNKIATSSVEGTRNRSREKCIFCFGLDLLPLSKSEKPQICTGLFLIQKKVVWRKGPPPTDIDTVSAGQKAFEFKGSLAASWSKQTNQASQSNELPELHWTKTCGKFLKAIVYIQIQEFPSILSMYSVNLSKFLGIFYYSCAYNPCLQFCLPCDIKCSPNHRYSAIIPWAFVTRSAFVRSIFPSAIFFLFYLEKKSKMEKV